MKKSICILSFSTIASDARVLRQIQYLSLLHDLTVIGYGPPPPACSDSPGIRWVAMQEQVQMPSLITALKNRSFKDIRFFAQGARKLRQARNLILSLTGIVFPPANEAWYWRQQKYEEAWRLISAIRCDAYHGNDWDTLPIVARAARKHNAALVMDLHEYAPLEYEQRPRWWIRKKFITFILGTYASHVHASTTVAPLIAERYRNEFGLDAKVLMNAPDRLPHLPEHEIRSAVRLIHHGVASSIRHPELMIEMMAHCHERYSLHLMFMENDYVKSLKRLAEQVAPGRVFFHNPVAPEDITHEILQYDAGLFLIPPENYNYHVCLPNKFFDFICAGLAVCIGPSPSMAEIVNRHGLGIVSPSFDPKDMASMLNRTTTEQWTAMRKASRKASETLNAGVEMSKLTDLYQSLFSERR